MSKILLLLAVIACACLPYNLLAQNQKEIDKLVEQLKTAKQDTYRVELLNNLAFEYRAIDREKAKTYLNNAIALSKKLNYKAGLCGAYNRYGIVYKNSQQFDSALKYLNMSLEIAKTLPEENRVADVYNNMGNVYRISGETVKGAEYFLKALKIREKIKDTSGIAAAYNNMAFIFMEGKNYSKGLENNQKAIYYFALARDTAALAEAYFFEATLYYYQDKFAEAVEANKRSLALYQAIGDKAQSAYVLNNLGNISTESGHPEEALQYHLKAIEIETITNDSVGLYTSNISLSQTYHYLHKYALAIKHGEIAMAILKNTQNSPTMLMEGYQILGEAYRGAKNYEKALDAYIQYSIYKDTIINRSNAEAVANMQEKYESDKKDLQIKKKQLELNNAHIKIIQRNVISFALVIVIVLLLIAAYLFYNRYRLKKQQELNEEIIQQQAIRSKAVIDAEEKERTRIAKDLHDGLGQQLSALKLLAQSVAHTDTSDERNEKIAALVSMTDDSVKEVRAISHNMMPNALIKSGLTAATREFVDKISATGVLKIDLQVIGLNNRLETTVETVLYRILQELVNNIIKHARANKISIQLIKDDDDGSINLMMEDDGVGFNTNNINNFKGIGLKNIMSRVEYLNGTVTFDSYPGKGTTVVIDIPA